MFTRVWYRIWMFCEDASELENRGLGGMKVDHMYSIKRASENIK